MKMSHILMVLVLFLSANAVTDLVIPPLLYKWEYKMIDLSDDLLIAETYAEVLNEMGGDGWELVDDPFYSRNQKMFFKRRRLP